jgi:hypothetical protein
VVTKPHSIPSNQESVMGTCLSRFPIAALEEYKNPRVSITVGSKTVLNANHLLFTHLTIKS